MVADIRAGPAAGRQSQEGSLRWQLHGRDRVTSAVDLCITDQITHAHRGPVLTHHETFADIGTGRACFRRRSSDQLPVSVQPAGRVMNIVGIRTPWAFPWSSGVRFKTDLLASGLLHEPAPHRF